MINDFMPDMPAIGESIRSISSGQIERPPQHRNTYLRRGGRGSNPRPTDYRPVILEDTGCGLSSVVPQGV
jgi:hypothetical protein